jgi:hypothetical protein
MQGALGEVQELVGWAGQLLGGAGLHAAACAGQQRVCLAQGSMQEQYQDHHVAGEGCRAAWLLVKTASIGGMHARSCWTTTNTLGFECNQA